jgi:hypothetical protein
VLDSSPNTLALICAAVEHQLLPAGAVQSRLIWVPEISAGKETGLPAKEG